MPSGTALLPKIFRFDPKKLTVLGTPDDPPGINIPLATLGVPVPYILGKQRVYAPNIIWYGNLRPEIETTTSVEEATVKVRELNLFTLQYEWIDVPLTTTTVTHNVVGFNLSMQFSLALGPGCVLKSIYVGSEQIFSGTVGPARTVVNLGANSTWLTGELIFSGGSFTQAPDPFLEDFIDPEYLPGYVGICHVIAKDIRADQILGRSLSFEIERFPNPLGLPSIENRLGDDMNVASMLADYIASDWGGAGGGDPVIDVASFTEAAETLAEEGLGGGLFIQSEVDTSYVIKALSDHADGIVFVDPNTETVKFKLIRRENIVPAETFNLNGRNVSNVNNWDRRSWIDTFNKLRISFTNRAKNYETDSVLGYNFVATNDKIKSNRTFALEYPTVQSVEGAILILQRELNVYGQPVVTASLETDRTAGELLPGDGVSMTLGDYGGAPVIGYVQKTQRFPLLDNRVILTLREVPSDTGISVEAEDGLADAINVKAIDAASVLVKQAPFYLAQKQGLDITAVNRGTEYLKPLFLVAPGDDYQNSFKAWISNKPGIGDNVQIVPNGNYATSASLVGAIDKYEGFDTGTIASITIDAVVNPVNLTSPGIAGVRAGELFMFIGNEVLSYETAVDNMDGTYTLTNVHRGLLDTVATAHSDNAQVSIIGANFDYVAPGVFDDPLGYTPNWRITSKGIVNEQDPDEDYISTTSWAVTPNRLVAPLRPHNTQIDGNPRSDSLLNVFGEEGLILSHGQDIDVTWASRARDFVGVQLQLDGAQLGETDPDTNEFMQHQVIIRDSGGTERVCGTTLSDASYNSIVATVPASTALGAGVLFVRSFTAYSGSIYEDQIPVFILNQALGDETGDMYLAGEAPNVLLISE